MPDDIALRSQHRPDAVARIIALPLQRHGPLQHRPHTLTYGPGRLRLDVPDRREDLQHVGAVDLGHRSLADARERVPLQTPQPVVRVVRAAPAAPLLLDDAPGRFRERGNAWTRRLSSANRKQLTVRFPDRLRGGWAGRRPRALYSGRERYIRTLRETSLPSAGFLVILEV